MYHASIRLSEIATLICSAVYFVTAASHRLHCQRQHRRRNRRDRQLGCPYAFCYSARMKEESRRRQSQLYSDPNPAC